MQIMEITLERRGTFRAITMIPNATKCAAMRTKNYAYYVKIDATNERLSKEGFVMNNECVDSYFQRRYGEKAKPWHAVSCERMALTAAQEIMNLLVSDGVSAKRVCCTLTGSNGATITAIYPPLFGGA